MQRPRSEGRRPASHSQSRSLIVSRSLQFGTGDHRERSSCSDLSKPRRPNTTPKPRIQRLLPAPGQITTLDWGSSRQVLISPLSTLIRLPDSPPRLLSMNSTECFNTTTSLDSRVSIRYAEKTTPKAMVDTSDSTASSIFRFQAAEEPLGSACPMRQLISGSCYCNNKEDVEVPSTDLSEHGISSNTLEPEQHEEHEQHEEKDHAPPILGPILADIHRDNNSSGSLLNGDDPYDTEDDDSEYKQALANRAQLLDGEATRQRIREELESYVGSLSSRTDGSGEHLVEFPRNYQQIVSLMTQKDVYEEDTKSQDGKSTCLSWSRVLIESGLSKQQAFGILEDGDDDPEATGSLAAKIALKMAHIRQLDTILEEKLGRNLYASIVPRRQKRVQSPPQPDVKQGSASRTNANGASSRTFVTQTQSLTASILYSRGSETSRSSSSRSQALTADDASSWNKDPGVKKASNFIERNKQVVANGMKANMTRDEENRLERLLDGEPSSVGDGTSSSELSSEANIKTEAEAVPQECNEFTMTEDEKKAIDELITAKSGAYPLFAIDQLQDGPTDDVLLHPGDFNRPTKENIIQETKRERLQRQRLSRVEQELRFLQESPSVVIVGDDHDEDDNEDCRSERSYATVASSTCSTRSGVISRHDFKCFLAQQKDIFQSTPTASAEEIRRLLLSMGHGSSAPSNAVTATTG